jgi:hypothetical protein
VVVIAAIALAIYCWRQAQEKERAEAEKSAGRRSSASGGTPSGALAAASYARSNSQPKT